MQLEGMDEASQNCASLLGVFRDRQMPVFHIQHIAAREGATFFVAGTAGCEIHPAVTPRDKEALVVKHYPNSFHETDLDEQLTQAGCKDVVICGAMSHMCIDTTTRAAFDLGYRCQLVADACATRDLQFEGRIVPAADVQAAFMAALAVPFAQVMNTKQLISEL